MISMEKELKMEIIKYLKDKLDEEIEIAVEDSTLKIVFIYLQKKRKNLPENFENIYADTQKNLVALDDYFLISKRNVNSSFEKVSFETFWKTDFKVLWIKARKTDSKVIV